jgi:cellulose synthase (UDP-forming)
MTVRQLARVRPLQEPKRLLGWLARQIRDFRDDLLSRKPYRRYLEREGRFRRVLGRILLVVNLIVGITYVVWMGGVLNFDVWYVTLPFYAAEVVSLLVTFCFAAIIWYPRHHRPTGPALAERPAVDVLIATCGEPVALLELTLKAAQQVHYANKTVYVLDDKASPAVRALAERYGCRYLSRSEHTDAKAGNLNDALNHTSGALILALDADQIPRPEILEHTVGYFHFADIGFVQTQQDFLLPQHDPFANSDELFYEVMQKSKDSDNAAFSCGSGVVYRRAALEQIGGFSTWNLVEDVHTSMLLHARGWRSVYHDHLLSTGTAPADIVAVANQREQWATDSLRILFWDNPFRYAGLSFAQKLQYFQIGIAYLVSALILPLFFVIPAWSIFTGQFLASTSALRYGAFRGVYFLATLLVLVVFQYPVDSRKPYRQWAGLFPVFFRAMLIALRSKNHKPQYHVTNKVAGPPPFITRLGAITPQLALLALNVVAIVYGLVRRTLPIGLLVVDILWAGWAVWSLWFIVRAALGTYSLPDPVIDAARAVPA